MSDLSPPGPDGPTHEKPHMQPLSGLARGGLYLTLGLILLALVFGGWGIWQVFGRSSGDQPTMAQLQAKQRKIDELEQRAATLARSDQISRNANADLQSTLSERDEEIAGLRADVAFYERFVGATAQRRGLAVHELKLLPSGELTWHFVATLTQNVNRGAVNAGRLQVAVEGTREGKLQRLGWADLRQQPTAPGVEYSFKYFQQVEGDLILPAGFEPTRVSVRLVPQGGSAMEQSFSWADSQVVPAAAP